MKDETPKPQPASLFARVRPKTIAVFLAVTLLPFGVASAVTKQCINDEDPCNPALLCSFEADLAGKVATYQAYLRNSQVNKNSKTKKREGIRYQGDLYDAALAEAKEKNPNASAAAQRRAAANLFNDNLRASLKDKVPQYKACGIPDVELDDSALPTWDGMHTSEDCNVYGDTEDGSVLLDDLKQDTGACLEFFERDVGHEKIHQTRCEERKKNPSPDDPYEIDQAIEEEIEAYSYSVKRAAADVQLLALKCSIDPALKTRRARAAALSKQLAAYKAKGR